MESYYAATQLTGPSTLTMDGQAQSYEIAYDYSPALSSASSFNLGGDRYTPLTPENDDRLHGVAFSAHQSPVATTDEYAESPGNGDITSEPYATLIYRALMSAPGHKMVLKEIYEWFERHTEKAKDPTSKGWQNSIRHNLSMNGSFKKMDQFPPLEDGKKGYVWVLDPKAVEAGGVESTTRYRSKGDQGKRVAKVGPLSINRPQAGARAGRVPRGRALRQRQISHQDTARALVAQVEATPQAQSDPVTSEEVMESTPATSYHHAVQPTEANAVLSHGFYDQDPYHMPSADSLAYDPVSYHQVPQDPETPSSGEESPPYDPNPYNFENISGCNGDMSQEPLFENLPNPLINDPFYLEWTNPDLLNEVEFDWSRYGHG